MHNKTKRAARLQNERKFAMTLTQKEQDLLKDLADSEKLCRDKYKKHSECAVDPQLKNLFTELSAIENGHYNTITDMQSGNVKPPVDPNKPNMTFSAKYGCQSAPDKDSDAYLCSDVLSMEKHVSQLYNTCVFEFENAEARDLLASIQKAEQNHGKLIYDYMKTNCMYS